MTDEFFKTIRRKSDEGGDRARAAEAAQTSRFRVRSTRRKLTPPDNTHAGEAPRLHPLKLLRLSNNKKERAF